MATRPNDDTGEIPLSQTLESLLTDVEFEIEGDHWKDWQIQGG